MKKKTKPEMISLEVSEVHPAFASVDGLLPCPLCELKYEVSEEGEVKLQEHMQEVHKVIV